MGDYTIGKLTLSVFKIAYSLEFPKDHHKLEEVLKDIRAIVSGDKVIPPERRRLLLNRFTGMFFRSGDGTYKGIESRLPSVFINVFPSWLKYHAKYLRGLQPDERNQGKEF